MKKVNFDVKLPAFVDRIVYVDNYGARPYCYTIEDASRNADAINRAINYISEKGGGTVVIPEGIWFTAPMFDNDNIFGNGRFCGLILLSKCIETC